MRLTQTAVALALAVIAAGPAGAETTAPAPDAAVFAPPQENAGAYLAARTALIDGSFADAAYWFDRSLQTDPDNLALLEGAMLASMSLGAFDQAGKAADATLALGAKSQFAALALIARDGKAEDFTAIGKFLAEGPKVNAAFDQLAAAWALAGQGEMTEAIAAFDKLSKDRAAGTLGIYHKALALAVVGDFEGADKVLSAEDARQVRQFRRAVMAHAQILSQLERNKDALKLLNEVFVPDQDLAIEEMKARLENGETLPWSIVQTPLQGLAEVYYSLAMALRGDADTTYTLLYSRAAAYLRPDHAEALLMSAAMLNDEGQSALASEVYQQVSPEAAEHYMAEAGRAQALLSEDKPDAALEVMQSLAKTYPRLRAVHVAYGDMLRREERYQDAERAYSAAIDLVETPGADDWSLYFLRGICHEQLKQYDKSEADLRQALKLKPDDPQALNFLGYSYLEQGRNYDEALDMIKRAVDAAPDNGAIMDSLAWAYFLLGRYPEALDPMERASLMEPLEPEVTDHLGDVYWAVGRKLEAKFQWRRALSFNPEEVAAARIRRKLEVGLDKVLAEEGAPPLGTVNAAANDN